MTNQLIETAIEQCAEINASGRMWARLEIDREIRMWIGWIWSNGRKEACTRIRHFSLDEFGEPKYYDSVQL